MKTLKKFAQNDYVNHIFEGDCLDIMEYFPDHCIDMVLCDLPYGTTQNKWDSVIQLDKLWEKYNRVVKTNGAVVLTSQGIFTAKLIMSNEKYFKYKIVWEKSKPTNFLNSKKQPLRKHEDICVFYKSQPTYNPQMTVGKPYSKGVRKSQFTGSYGNFHPALVESKDGLRYPTDIIYFKTPESESGGEVWHPTQKPVELGRYLIRTFSNPGDVILDNTSGAGSFLVSALMEQRNFVGIEKNQDARLFKEESINLIKISNDRIYKAFITDTKLIFSSHIQRCGIIKEFIQNGQNRIAI
jgi:site-specific DNA-methyltransferase (adenine-specific)/modification methylase